MLGLAFVVLALQTPLVFGQSVPHNPALSGTNTGPVQLLVKLTDGSRVIGTTTLTSLPLRSEALGMLTIRLNQIRALKFSPNHESVSVALANGDQLQGSLGTVSLKMQTLVGEVPVPLEQTVEIRVTASLDGKLSDGLIAYYPFAEDAEDHSGHQNNGQIVRADFQSDAATGRKALQVTGTSSSYVLVPRTDSLEPTDGITISMWVKGVPGQAAGQGWGTILRKANNFQPGYFIRGGGISAFQLFCNTPGAVAYYESAGFLEFTATKWQHIVATYSRADGVLATYQDGELINQKSLAEPLFHSGDLYIGGAAVASDDGGFAGLIAEVRIYNRGLSVAEVRALFNGGLNAHG